MPRSAESLIGTVGPMLKWLRTKKPREIVATSMLESTSCLGASFLQAHGYENAYFYVTSGRAGGREVQAGIRFSCAIAELCRDYGWSKGVTAAQAIKVFEKFQAMPLKQVWALA